jgi:hypothetical protein
LKDKSHNLYSNKISDQMKRLVLALMVMSLIMVSRNASTQNLGRIVRKTVVEPTRTANDIAQDKAEEEAEKHITNAIMEGFGISDDARYNKEYKFDSWFEMQITEYKKNGKMDSQVVYDNYFSKEKLDYGMEYREDETRSTILYIADSSTMLILTDEDGEKTGFATRFDPEKLEGTTEEEKPENSGLESYKTGNTKKILGYTCDEYLIEDEDSEVHMWVSEKLGKEINSGMLSNPNAFGNAFLLSRSVNGMTMEYELMDKSSGEKTEMLVTDLDLNRDYSIHTEGYNILTMNMQE